MMTNGGRIATPKGAMLADWGLLGNVTAAGPIFDPKFWADRNELHVTPSGRGSAWFIGPDGRWVLRHYRRGGLIARLSRDRYWWRSEPCVRAFAEWHLHRAMRERGLPVPKPVAAAYQRLGLTYRCDLITERIAATRPLSAVIGAVPLPQAAWQLLGGVLARFHRAGVDHVDLNAHNILYSEQAASFYVIDFDRGRLREAGAGTAAWQLRNLKRLHRSLVKVAPVVHFGAREWNWLLAGYR